VGWQTERRGRIVLLSEALNQSIRLGYENDER